MIKNEHLDHTTSQEAHEFNSSPTSWVHDYIIHHRLEKPPTWLAGPTGSASQVGGSLHSARTQESGELLFGQRHYNNVNHIYQKKIAILGLQTLTTRDFATHSEWHCGTICAYEIRVQWQNCKFLHLSRDVNTNSFPQNTAILIKWLR